MNNLEMKPGGVTLGRVDLPSPPTAPPESHNPQSSAYYARIKELEARVQLLESLLAFASRPGVQTSAYVPGLPGVRPLSERVQCRVHCPQNPVHDAWYGATMEETLTKALRAESQRPG